MKSFVSIIFAGCFISIPTVARADFQADLGASQQALNAVMPQAEALIAAGKIDEANAKVLSAFPEKSRTAAQAFMLGNILFRQDPKTSYALHKRAAAELPNEAEPQLEWAMEQHRAGEYAGAADSYAQFSKANPDFAPAYGLTAECLIRVGKTREAVEAWQHSEHAPRGSLEQLESWVCEVNTHRYPQRDRASFLSMALAGNIQSAEKLIALDAAFPRDWWNAGPQVNYLKRDLAQLRNTKFTDNARLGEILCAGDCALAADAEGNVAGILQKNTLLLDAKGTLPQSGVILSSILHSAFETHAVTKSEARTKWGEAILKQAQADKDAELFNVAANLYLNSDQLPEIDRLGWEITGDVRFAASLVVVRAGEGNLQLDDPTLSKATKQFPEDAIIAGIVVQLTARSGKPLEPALINAIKAEYSHFSPDRISARASAGALRGYFVALAKEIPAK